MSPFGWLWTIFIGILAVAAQVVVLTQAGPDVRIPVIFCFLLLCPGLAIVRFMGLASALMQLTLAIGVSLTLDTLIAGLFVYAGHWSAAAALSVIVQLTLAITVLNLIIRLWPAMLQPAPSLRRIRR